MSDRIDATCPTCGLREWHVPNSGTWVCTGLECKHRGPREDFLDWSGSMAKKEEPPAQAVPETVPPPPGTVTYYPDPKPTSKGDSPMKIKRFIVRSFLRSFRHSLFILATWKAVELVHWAWPGLKLLGRMAYPPIYAVAHAVDGFVAGPGMITTGDKVVIIWIGIIIVAFVAVALLRLAWLGLNRLARAAFIEAVK